MYFLGSCITHPSDCTCWLVFCHEDHLRFRYYPPTDHRRTGAQKGDGRHACVLHGCPFSKWGQSKVVVLMLTREITFCLQSLDALHISTLGLNMFELNVQGGSRQLVFRCLHLLLGSKLLWPVAFSTHIKAIEPRQLAGCRETCDHQAVEVGSY